MAKSDLKCSIGKRVHDFRIQNDYTQAQFAELMDISVNFLSEIENGKKGMSQETICRLCSHFQISADYILFGSETVPQNKAKATGKLVELANELEPEDLALVIEYLTSLKKIKENSL